MDVSQFDEEVKVATNWTERRENGKMVENYKNGRKRKEWQKSKNVKKNGKRKMGRMSKKREECQKWQTKWEECQ